ncbi:MAG: M60 family metallopeptidase [Bacteroidaceae bacterium]|nr:M60 family metallopeptidase [Bacteroidaceae bacterium]
MKRFVNLFLCLIVAWGLSAQDAQVAINSVVASSAQPGNEAALAADGNAATIWHSTWGNNPTKFPVTFTMTLAESAHVDYVRYTPRQDGNNNGNWNEVTVAYCPTTTGSNFVDVGTYYLNGAGVVYDFYLADGGVECGKVRFTIKSGANGFASAAEITPYAIDDSKSEAFAPYFTDGLFTQLKPGVTGSEGIEDADVKALVDNLLADAEEYKKFRVGEYEAYMTPATVRNTFKISSQYNNYENPTGVYLKTGESCIVMVSGIAGYPVGLKIRNWYVNEDGSSYSLRNGMNFITATSEGNVFVDYYTDEFRQAPNVKVHFINAPVQGYWDQATMTNEDWKTLLKGRSTNDHSILITRSEHAQLAYPVSAWLKYCPDNVDSTMTLYQQVQWAERDIMGLSRYGRQVKNRQLFYATNYGFMAAGGEGAYCHYNSLGGIMCPDAAKFDFWGVGHEWGHNNQVTPGFKWSGCGETTNNIYASWAQFHFTGNRNAEGKPASLRLEDETSGIDEYAGMRGGRMQTYFEEAIRKGVAWQLQDGPDYHGTTPATKTVAAIDADGKSIGTVTTTSRNYDHFVKLVPFWQLNLWGTLAGKCPDIIPMVIEGIRTTPDYGTAYNTNGKQQVNWMKLACDSARIDLLPFFEKAGMLRPIHAYIEDYGAGWNIITEEMIAALRAYVKEQGYPAFTEEINYINGHNYHIYRDNLKLETPEAMGQGCKLSGNKVTVQHDVVKNAVAFETYNVLGELLRITMYGLGGNDSHTYTQVLYPKTEDMNTTSAYIMAVGYDGTRVKIYEEAGDMELTFLRKALTEAKSMLALTDDTGTYVGYYKPEYLAGFQSLVAEIQAVVDNADTSVHTYGEWLVLLNQAIADMQANSEAKVPLYTENYYTLGAVGYKNTSLEYSTAGLKVTFAAPAGNARKQWMFVPGEEDGQYYMQNVESQLYVSVAAEGARVKATAATAETALPFIFVEVEPARFLLQSVSNPDCFLSCDAGKNVIASSDKSSMSQWTLAAVVDNHTASMKAMLEQLMAWVDITLGELVAAREPELQLYDDVIVLDANLPAYVAALLAAYDEAVQALESGKSYLDAYFVALESAHNQVKTSYQKALSLPEASEGSEVMCYYLQCLDTEAYAYHFEGAGRYNGAIRTGELADATDRNFWFYLRPGETEGQYYIYNWQTAKAVGVSGKYLYVNGTVDPDAYTISIAEESYGFTIGTTDGVWGVQAAANGYAQFTKTAAMWKFVPIGKYDTTGIVPVLPAPSNDVYYDLLGRPVESPSAGIYICNGRKVVIK